MPLTSKGQKILANMRSEYGADKGERVFYASRNKGTITGVDPGHWRGGIVGYAEGGIVNHDRDPDLPPIQDHAELVPLTEGARALSQSDVLNTIELLKRNRDRAQGIDDPNFFYRPDREREAPRPRQKTITPQAWPFPNLRRRYFGPSADGIEEISDGASKGWGRFARGGRIRYFEDGGGGDGGGGGGGCSGGCGDSGCGGACGCTGDSCGSGACGACSCGGSGCGPGSGACNASAGGCGEAAGACTGCSGAGGGNGGGASGGAEGDAGVGGCLGGCTAAAAAAAGAAFGAEGQTGQTGEGRGGGPTGTGLGATAGAAFGLGAQAGMTGQTGQTGQTGMGCAWGGYASGAYGYGGPGSYGPGGMFGSAGACQNAGAFAGGYYGTGGAGIAGGAYGAETGGQFGANAGLGYGGTGAPGTGTFGAESTAGGGGTNGIGAAGASFGAGFGGTSGYASSGIGDVSPSPGAGRGGGGAEDDQGGGRSGGDRGGGSRGGDLAAALSGDRGSPTGSPAGTGVGDTGMGGAGGEPSGGPSDIGGNIGGGPQGGPAASVATDVSPTTTDQPAAPDEGSKGGKSGTIAGSAPAAPATGSFTGQVGDVSVSPATAANTGGLGGGTFGSTAAADPSVPGGFAAPTGDISPASFDVGNPFGDPNQGLSPTGGTKGGGLGGGLSTTGTMAGTSPTGFDAVGNTSLTGQSPTGFTGSVAPAGMSLDAMSLSPTGFGPAGEFTGGRTGNIGVGTHGSVAPGGATDIASLAASPTALSATPGSFSNQTGGQYGLSPGSFTGGQQGGGGPATPGAGGGIGAAAPAASISDLGPAAGEAAQLGGEPAPGDSRGGGRGAGEAAPMGGAPQAGGGWTSSGRGGEAAALGGEAPVGGTPAGLAAGEAAPMGGGTPAGATPGIGGGIGASPAPGAATAAGIAAGEAAQLGGEPAPGDRGGGRAAGEAAPLGGAFGGVPAGGWTSSGRGGEAAPMGGAAPAGEAPTVAGEAAPIGGAPAAAPSATTATDIAAAHAAAQAMQDQQMAVNPALDVAMEKAAAAQQGQQGRGGFTGQVGNVAVAPATAATTQGLYGGLYGSQEPGAVDLSSVGIATPGNVGGLSFGPGNAFGDPNYGLAATEDIGQPAQGGRSGAVPGGSWADQTFGSLANFGGLTGSRGTTGVSNIGAAQQGFGPGFGPAAATGDWTSGGRDATLGWGAPTGLAAVAQGNLGAPMESVTPQTTPAVGPGEKDQAPFGGGRSGGLDLGTTIASALGISPAAAQGLSEDRASLGPAAQVGAPMDLAQVAQQTQEPDARSLASAITGWSDKDLAAALAPAANTISNIGSWLGAAPTGGWLGLGTPANAQDLNTFGSTKGTSGYGPGQGGAWTSGTAAAAPGGTQSAEQSQAADQALSDAVNQGSVSFGPGGGPTGSVEQDTPAEIAAPPADLDPAMVAPAVPALERGVTDPERTGSRGLATLAAYAPNERGGQPSFGPQSNPFSGQQTTPTTPDPGFEAPQSERGTVTNAPLGDLAPTAQSYAATTQDMTSQSPALSGGNLGYSVDPSFGANPPGDFAPIGDQTQTPDRGGKGDRGFGPGTKEGEAPNVSTLSGDYGHGVHASPGVDFGGLSAYSYGEEPMGLNTLGIDRSGTQYGIASGGYVRHRAGGGIVGDSIKQFVDVSPSAAAGMVDQNPLTGFNLARTFPPNVLYNTFEEVGHNRRDQNPPQGDDSNKQPQQLQITVPGASGGGTFTGMAQGGYVDAPGYYAPGGLTPASMRTYASGAHYSAMNMRPAIGRQPGVHLISSSVPGRTDRIPQRAKPGSYVLPADVVSGLGQGNTMAGARMWGQAIQAAAGPVGVGTMGGIRRGSMPMARRPGARGFADGGAVDDDYVPIVTAGGEVLVDPEFVEALGNGSEMLGKRKLAESVLNVRKQTIAHLKSLPRPVK